MSEFISERGAPAVPEPGARKPREKKPPAAKRAMSEQQAKTPHGIVLAGPGVDNDELNTINRTEAREKARQAFVGRLRYSQAAAHELLKEKALVGIMADAVTGLMLVKILAEEAKPKDAEQALKVARGAAELARELGVDPDVAGMTDDQRAQHLHDVRSQLAVLAQELSGRPEVRAALNAKES